MATLTTSTMASTDLSDEEGALSTTPSSSSECGGSSVEAPPPTPSRPRVQKRSFRGELRWLGWSSPARKRLRSSPPPTPPPRAAHDDDLHQDGLQRHQDDESGLSCLREYDGFWRLVGRIAKAPSGEPVWSPGWSPGWARLCEDGGVAVASPPSSTPTHCSCSADDSRDSRGNESSSGSCNSSPPSPLPATQSVILATDDDDIVEALNDDVPRPHREDGVADDHPASASGQQPHELLERLQFLSSRSHCEGAADPEQDKLDVEEDGSVLQLLVLTPTEERKLGPRAPCSIGGSAGGPRRTLRSAVGAVGVEGGAKCRGALDCLLRLRAPYFFLLLGLVQVSLFAAPTPYGAQEMKNMFVWNSSCLFQQPWRLVSYAMLHSGQMHVTLNVGVQTIVGAPLEREQGALRVAGAYFGGAVYGALGTGVISPALLMVGASAGIYSILMSHLAQIILNPGTVRYGKTRAGAVLLLTSADMVYTAHHALQRGNAAPRIGVTAHCAGAMSGLFLGLALYRGGGGGGGVPDQGVGGGVVPGRLPGLLRASQIGSGLLLAFTAAFSVVWIFLAQQSSLLLGH